MKKQVKLLREGPEKANVKTPSNNPRLSIKPAPQKPQKSEPKILFTKESAPFILEALGYDVDSSGFIINKTLKSRALTREGEEIHIDEFAGIYKEGNATIFIKGDLPAIMKFIKNKN